MIEPETLALFFVVGLVIYGTSLHEMGHAYVATWLGDPTPGKFGRLTLNPLPHLNPFFTAVLLPLISFFLNGSLFCVAMTPIDPSRLRRPLRDHALIALAGPAMNVLLAAVLLGILWIPGVYRFGNPTWASLIFPLAARYNLILAVFNLIPVPPLDGYNLLRPVLPLGIRRQADAFARMGSVSLLAGIVLASIVFMQFLNAPVDNFFDQLMPPGF